MDEVYKWIESKGKVTRDELLKWAKENEIGSLIAAIVVNDLLDEGRLIGEGNYEPPSDAPFAPAIPAIIRVPKRARKQRMIIEVKKEEKQHKVKPSRQRATVKSGIKRTTTLIEFLFEEKAERKKAEERVVETPRVESVQVEIEKEEVGEEEKIGGTEEEYKELAEYEEDVRKAIIYLNEYHSVGEYRFFEDLKAMGVKNPRQVMYKLLSLGFIVRHKLGVIDATDKLPKVKVKKVPLGLEAFM